MINENARMTKLQSWNHDNDENITNMQRKCVTKMCHENMQWNSFVDFWCLVLLMTAKLFNIFLFFLQYRNHVLLASMGPQSVTKRGITEMLVWRNYGHEIMLMTKIWHIRVCKYLMKCVMWILLESISRWY